MFYLSLPGKHDVGDTVDCRINGEPLRVHWRDAKHLVIGPDDVREILSVQHIHDPMHLVHFICSDAGEPRAHYRVDREPSGGGFVASRKEKGEK